ncbi:MAG: hypothetical protein ACREBN_11720 [Burkholderiaceae bacterium]
MTDPEIFIVRVWRQLAGGFRASARRVDEEEAQFFSRPDDVATFLSTAVDPAASDAQGDEASA